MRTLGTAAFLALSASCGAEQPASCDRTPGPVTGARSDYTLRASAGSSSAYRVGEPAECGLGSVLPVGGNGPGRLSEDADAGCSAPPTIGDACLLVNTGAFVRDLASSLRAAGVAPLGFGTVRCNVERGDTAVSFAQINDWRRADTAVDVVGTRLMAWHIGDPFVVLVAGATPACALSRPP